MLSVEQSKKRQERLLERMAEHKIDLAVVSDYRHVYYLTGRLAQAEQPTILLLGADGSTILIAPEGPGEAAADRVLMYPVFSIEKLIDDLVEDAAMLLTTAVRDCGSPIRLFVEATSLPMLLSAVLRDAFAQCTWIDLRPTMLALRRCKDPDEVDSIRDSIRIAEAGYRAARNVMEVGRTELDIHAAMYTAMVQELASSFRLDGDFATGQRANRGGGPPTSRAIEPGDLYVLDIFPRIEGYACDLCRTFAVDRPSEAQREAWELVHGTLEAVAAMIRLGITGGVVREEMQRRLHASALARDSFFHHAGHGIGLQPHESPRMIIGCEHTFEVGNVFTLEPGIYGEHLQGGIRLEHNYVLTEQGPEQLDSFPMDL